MINLQVLPEPQLSLQVMGQITKAGEPVILPRRITENGTYYAGSEKAAGYNPVTVDVDMTSAKEEGYLNGYEAGAKEGAEAGYAKGKQAEYNAFWDAFQDNGNRVGYSSAFSGAYWNNANFRPKYSIVPSSYGVSSMFESCGYEGDLAELCEQQGITIDFSNGVEFSRTFYGTKFTRIGVIDARKATRFYYVFNYSSNLKTIDKIISAETTPYNTAFGGLRSLEEIRFAGIIGASLAINESPLLSNASVQSIIDHLKDLTGATAQTLTFHATVGAKLTQAQKDAISAKNWTLVY